MTDYISREALLKMIGTMPSSPITDREERLIRAFISTVKNFPAADVRPVVLCRDCKYFSEVMYKGTQFEYGYCDRWADGTRMNPEDFCSRGEKREGQT